MSGADTDGVLFLAVAWGWLVGLALVGGGLGYAALQLCRWIERNRPRERWQVDTRRTERAGSQASFARRVGGRS